MKSRSRHLALCCVFLFALGEAQATQDAFSNVIVDYTQTPYAHHFCLGFSNAMNNVDDEANVRFSTLTVNEKPHIRSGSSIKIEDELGILMQITLHAGSNTQAERMGAEAAAWVKQKLTERMLDNALMQDPDLGKNELK
ncbi:MAG: CsgE family curli-type amyloid fiber assembly protein [Sideroxydans sp.]|nr:CsgE family curli-type amyloid fiber assembly protein [Sideroxydans sp.]